jgi:hypothetical protein
MVYVYGICIRVYMYMHMYIYTYIVFLRFWRQAGRQAGGDLAYQFLCARPCFLRWLTGEKRYEWLVVRQSYRD